MLILESSGEPCRSKSPIVQYRKISSQPLVMSSSQQQSRDQVRQRIFSVVVGLQNYLIVTHFPHKIDHPRHVLTLVNSVELVVCIYQPVMEIPINQPSNIRHLLLLHKLACFCIREYLLADWDGPFDHTFYYRPLDSIKVQIEHVKVRSTIDGAHKWHVLVPVVDKLVAVPTDYAVNRVLGELIYELCDLIMLARWLGGAIGADIVGFVLGTFVPEVCYQDYYLCAISPKFDRLSDHYLRVVEKSIFGEFFRHEPRRGCGSLCGRQAQDSKLNPAQVKDGRRFLLRQKLFLVILGVQIGGEGRGLSGIQIIQQKL